MTVAMTWTSLQKSSGNSGRIGRSIRREVSVSFSVGRPSRLKKPPGMRPAGVGLLDVVDGEREEILARHRFAATDGRDEHGGVTHGDEDGAIGLAGDAGRFRG